MLQQFCGAPRVSGRVGVGVVGDGENVGEWGCGGRVEVVASDDGDDGRGHGSECDGRGKFSLQCFMLPVSTPQNAIVYGSGAVRITTVIRTGITFDIIGARLIIVALPVMVSLTGLGS